MTSWIDVVLVFELLSSPFSPFFVLLLDCLCEYPIPLGSHTNRPTVWLFYEVHLTVLDTFSTDENLFYTWIEGAESLLPSYFGVDVSSVLFDLSRSKPLRSHKKKQGYEFHPDSFPLFFWENFITYAQFRSPLVKAGGFLRK
jgi:hypothetical protein